ncbi:MAG: IPT/TIG domain-containing protein, partial [bacterium]|nr:IPT/TIG domain-containing protein [bacterium]
MTVNGSGFIASSQVRFNGANRTTTYISATQLTAAIPSSDLTVAGPQNITVFNPTPGGGPSNTVIFTVTTPPPPPTITSISPTSTPVNSGAGTITVNGTNFISSSVVQWNGASRITTFVSATRLTVAIPASDLTTVGAKNITVFTPAPGGGLSNTVIFTVTNPIPAITSISPTSAPLNSPGGTMTVNGSGFISSSQVRFNGSSRTTTYISATQLTAAILNSDLTVAGPQNITVFNPTPGGGPSNTVIFTVTTNPVPTCSDLDNASSALIVCPSINPYHDGSIATYTKVT